MALVSLPKLVRDVTQATYKDLHETLDAASDASPDSRRERMFHFTMRTRHRVARLMVALQWWSDFSAFHQSATVLRDAAVSTADGLALAADALWSTAHAAQAATAVAPALGPASQILGSNVFRRLPRIIEESIRANMDGFVLDSHVNSESGTPSDAPPAFVDIGRSCVLDADNESKVGSAGDGTKARLGDSEFVGESVDSLDTDAVLRLGATTRNLIRLALPAGCKVLSWRVDGRRAAVCIGCQQAWSAHVVLSGLDLDVAVFVVLEVALHVSSDSDAPGQMKRSSRFSSGMDASQNSRRRDYAAKNLGGKSEATLPGNERDGYRVVFSREIEKEVRTLASFRIHAAAELSGRADSLDLDTPEGKVLAALVSTDSPLAGGCSGSDPAFATKGQVRRARSMISALASLMCSEIAGVFALDHVRSQSSALQAHVSWRNCGLRMNGTSKSASAGSPVVVQYWTNTSEPASLNVMLPESQDHGSTDAFGILVVRHEPPLLGVQMPLLDVSAINLEELLLASASRRATASLCRLGKSIRNEFVSVPVSGVLSYSGSVCLRANTSSEGGVEVSVSLKTGSWVVSLFGSARLSQARSCPLEVCSREAFSSYQDALEACSASVLSALRTCELNYVYRACHAMDIPALDRPLPGQASRAPLKSCIMEPEGLFETPLIPVEILRPQRFLSLAGFDESEDHPIEEVDVSAAISPNPGPSALEKINARPVEVADDADEATNNTAVEPAVDKTGAVDATGIEVATRVDDVEPSTEFCFVRLRSLKRSSRADGLTFVQSKKPRLHVGHEWPSTLGSRLKEGLCCFGSRGLSGQNVSSVGLLWSETVARLARDRLLQALLHGEVLSDVLETCDWPHRQEMDPPLRTQVTVFADPLPVITAEVVVYGNDQWSLNLRLLNSAIDLSWNGVGCAIAFDKAELLLSFKYVSLDENTFDRFFADFGRVRAMAHMASGLSKSVSERWTVSQTSPTDVIVRADGLSVEVGCSDDAYEVSLHPKGPAMNALGPLVEEVVNECGKSSGEVLAALLDRSCAIASAIDKAKPQDGTKCRVGFTTCMKARIVMGADATCSVVDVDSSKSEKLVLVVDYGRVIHAAPSKEGAKKLSAARSKYRPVPHWERMVAHLVSKGAGRETYNGSAILLTMSLLPNVIRAIVNSVSAQRTS